MNDQPRSEYDPIGDGGSADRRSWQQTTYSGDSLEGLADKNEERDDHGEE